MKNVLWIALTVIITVVLIAAAFAWKVFVMILSVGLHLAPFVLFVLLILWIWRRSKTNKK